MFFNRELIAGLNVSTLYAADLPIDISPTRQAQTQTVVETDHNVENIEIRGVQGEKTLKITREGALNTLIYPLNVTASNLDIVNHFLSDGITIAARTYLENPVIELVSAPYRWLSGGFMWYKNQQRRQEYPSQALNIQNWAILSHLGADALEVMYTYAPYYTRYIAESIPYGEYIEGSLNLVQGVSAAVIMGTAAYATYQNMNELRKEKQQ